MNSTSNSSYEFGPFLLNSGERLLVRDGQAVILTPKAFETLLLLVENSGHVLTKEQMLTKLWPDTFVEEANLTNNISILRRALGDDPEGRQYIKTVPRLGYRFEAAVKQVGEEKPDGSAPALEVPELENLGHITSPVIPLVQKERGIRRGLVVGVLAAAVLTALVIGGVMTARRRAGTVEGQPVHIRSIAVLPLTNLSGDPTQEYFADGMTEALITELAKIGQLRIISRASIMQYKHARKTSPEIARELKVDAVVQGSVFRSNDRVRITAQLIRAESDEHIWAESYERDLRDVLALQGEVARGIVNEIKINLSPQQQQSGVTNTRVINPAAHDAYLKGLYWLHKAIDEPTEEFERFHHKSFEYFEQSIAIDPNYGLAYSKLAVSYHFLASSGFPQFYPKAKRSALKAIALDDSQAGAHGALAYTMWRHEWDFAGAEREFRRAEQLEPNATLSGYAQFLSSIGRHDEAIRRFKLAQDLDPMIVYLKILAGDAYLEARQFDQAITQFISVLELDPKQFGAQGGLGNAYVLKGMYGEGIAAFQRALDISGQYKPHLGWAYAMAGRRSEAINILNEVKDPSQQKSIQHLGLAKLYGALGEKDLAMEQLEKAYAKRQGGILWLKVNPTFDNLRSDPRFQNLLQRIGLPL